MPPEEGTLLIAHAGTVLWPDPSRQEHNPPVVPERSLMLVVGRAMCAHPGRHYMLKVVTEIGVGWVNDFPERYTTIS